MTTIRNRPILPRAVVVSVAMALGLLLSACGSDDSSQKSDSPVTGDSVTSQSGQSDSGEELPEGLPADIPLPQDAALVSSTEIGAATGWRLMYTVDPEEEGRQDTYASRLADAGFEIETTGVNIIATSADWRVDAVIRPPVLTIQIMDYS